jgi:hypothetical protein
MKPKKNDVKKTDKKLENAKKKNSADADANEIQNDSDSSSLNIFTMIEIAKKLKVKDTDTVKKWLAEKSITIHKAGKQCYVYAIDFNYTMAIPLVTDLKRKYPVDWQNIYSRIEKNEAVYHLVVRQLSGIINAGPTTIVSLKNNDDLKLLKELTA